MAINNKVILFSILAVTTILQILIWTNGHDWGGDFASYILQAISIFEGNMETFVSRNSFTILESDQIIGPISYPWGVPLLLVPAYALFGTNIIGFKLVMLLCLLLFQLCLWILLQNKLEKKELIILLMLFACNPYILGIGNNVLSELPFIFFSTLSILVMQKIIGHKEQGHKVFPLVILGVLFATSISVRTMGIVLPVLYIILMIISYLVLLLPNYQENKFSEYIFFPDLSSFKGLLFRSLPIFILILVWSAVSLILPQEPSSSYLKLFEMVNTKTIFENILYYLTIGKDFFGSYAISSVIYTASLILIFLGIKDSIYKKISLLFLIYTLLILGVYIVWPFKIGFRALLPVTPFCLYFLILGLRNFQTFISSLGLPKFSLHFLLVAFFMMQTLYSVYINNFILKREISDGPYSYEAKNMFEFIKQNVADNEVVNFRKPRVMRMFSDKDSVYKQIIEPNSKSPFNWYVIDKNRITPSEQKIDTLNLDAVKRFENKNFIIYEFLIK